MEALKISGPTEFKGNVKIQGSKNAVLPMMAASVINRGITTLTNCPDISDVRDAADILKYIGCKVSFDGGVLTIDSTGEILNHIPCEIMGRIRASFLFAGALLARCKGFVLSQPGGCNIGLRPVDIHLESFRKLGATVETSASDISCMLERFTPDDLVLRFPSVGATENIMIFAAGVTGKVRIHNAAREPEIVDLQNMLNAMGAHITGAGTSVIAIEGTDNFNDVSYKVMSDRIDAATYLTALACCSGSIILENADSKYLMSYINILKKCGMDIEVLPGRIVSEKNRRLKGGVNVNTKPYPGFPTDMQSMLMSVLSLSDGVSIIRENIFENRFCLAGTLSAMGADIRIYRRTASVRGVRSLAPVRGGICDLRSGAALACAMMSSEGISLLTNIHLIDRGYENFHKKYESIGAHIERIEDIEV